MDREELRKEFGRKGVIDTYPAEFVNGRFIKNKDYIEWLEDKIINLSDKYDKDVWYLQVIVWIYMSLSVWMFIYWMF